MTIKEMRKLKRVSQKDLAKGLNVSQPAVSMYETGDRQPDISLIPKFAEILHCSIEEIVYCFCNV